MRLGLPRKEPAKRDLAALLSARHGEAVAKVFALDGALAELTKELGLTFVSFRRIGSHGGKLSIRGSKMYYMLTAAAPRDLKDRDKIDDIIYDDLAHQLKSVD